MQPTARDLEKQQRREIAEIRRGEKAYQEAMLVKDPSSLPSGKRLMREIIPALTDAIGVHQEACLEAIKRPHGQRRAHVWVVQLVNAQTLAFLTLDVALRNDSSLGHGHKEVGLTQTAMALARSVRAHAEVHALAERDKVDVLALLKKRYGAVNRMTWSRWKKKLGAETMDWSPAVQLHLGAALINTLLTTFPEHFEKIVVRREGGVTQSQLQLKEGPRAVMNDVEQRRSVALPHYMPMIIKPLDWRFAPLSLSGMPSGENAPTGSTGLHSGRLEGGYVIHRLAFVRTGLDEHTKALPGAVGALDLEAANRIQSTGWAVNSWLYDVMSEAWTKGYRLGDLETGEMLPHAHLSDEAFAGLSKEDKTEHCRKRLGIHKANAKRKGRYNQIVDYLAVARELRDEPVFYYPHVQDFRHRIYPVPVRGPHPQGDDLAKSLIHFAEGKPLGETGEFWLCVHAANCAGKDKLTLQERVAWTLSHSQEILGFARAPLQSVGWTEADQPWCFLAACYELSQCWTTPTSAEFTSHLPIALDGSCNGIQHLSAMGLDPIGAEATNLKNGPRQDIYQLIADKVSDRVEQDAANGDAIASAWLGKITRKTCKRSCMTTPYGVTPRGIRGQLLADELVPGNDGKLADYLRDRICEALEGTAVAAKEIMSWLQGCAKALAKAGLPMRWQTPSGSWVEQAYHSTTSTKLHTLCGQLTILEEDAKSTLKPAKQALASAPNCVHSFDAAHLAMTVVAGAERGISHWATVHDSFATHAANTQALSAVLREQFVSIYQHNWLERLHAGFKAYAPNVTLPAPPVRGSFDIEETHDAEFFFS